MTVRAPYGRVQPQPGALERLGRVAAATASCQTEWKHRLVNQPDLYTAAAQLIPVLFLAILFELRLLAPFLRRLMENEIKLGLLHEAERQRRTGPEGHLPDSRLFDM